MLSTLKNFVGGLFDFDEGRLSTLGICLDIDGLLLGGHLVGLGCYQSWVIIFARNRVKAVLILPMFWLRRISLLFNSIDLPCKRPVTEII